MYTVNREGISRVRLGRHNEQHLTKHGISRSDAEDVLSGSHILLEYQTEGDEQRWVAVGATRVGRILSIVFAIREGSNASNNGLACGQRDSRPIRQGVGAGL